MLRISSDSSCISSAASHAGWPGDAKNDIRVIFTLKMLRYRRLILQLRLRRPSLFCSNRKDCSGIQKEFHEEKNREEQMNREREGNE